MQDILVVGNLVANILVLDNLVLGILVVDRPGVNMLGS